MNVPPPAEPYQEESRPRFRWVIWLLLAAAVVTAVALFADDALYYATGQDILDDLQGDINTFPTATLVVYPTASTPVDVVQATATNTPSDGGEPDSGQDSIVEGEPAGFGLRLREHVYKYTIQAGDSLSVLAQRFELNINTIFWANTETLQDNVHLLYIGTDLYILPVDGVYHKSDGSETIADIAASYNVAPEAIILSEHNELSAETPDSIPMEGLRIVVPGGSREYISWRAPIRTGQIGAANPQGTIHPGSCSGNYLGTGGVGHYADPMASQSYVVTNEFAVWHAGIDLARPLGAPIYAAETGVIVFAGWHLNGYGELVILDHGEGWTTYYAHLADRYANCGEQISKGQILGTMGQTGNATGVHLHFEVRYEDIPQNPRDYVNITGTVRLDTP